MNAPFEPAVVALAAYGIPLTYLGAAALGRPARPLATAGLASAVGFALAAIVAAATAAGDLSGTHLGLRLDLVTAVMLTLVTFIGLVITRYSRTYLDGDPGRQRYTRWLMVTLSAVATLVSTAHIGLLAAAWTVTSLALHQLLTFFRDRPAAQVAAHKKFLVSRLADLCLWTGIALLYGRVGSLWMGDVEAWIATLDGGGSNLPGTLPAPVQLATFLFVIAACLKSAQLPFHGWLTQVMEAPTPVSALLHAGVVNIGGFLMIRLAELMALAPLAQGVLVLIGLITTILAALVMTTRVSVKVGLAWSTCAQMGLMLVQCGLGAWHLALLHLVAHSLYKAHAFLASGSTVEEWRAASILPKPAPLRARSAALAAVLSIGVVAAASIALHDLFGPEGETAASRFALIIATSLSLVPMIAYAAAGGPARIAAALPKAAAVVLLFFGWHAIAADALALPVMGALYLTSAWTLVGAGFAALFFVQLALEVAPNGRFARWLHPWLFAGFYLDELFTRLTFRVWPPRPSESDSPSAVPAA